MPLRFNIRHLEHKPLKLKGELPAAELDLEGVDELIRVTTPIRHELQVEQYGRSLLVQGSLEVTLQCECARCLKPFEHRLRLPAWSSLLPLEGEDCVPVSNDCVDLTPYVREDILLAFPQNPLCGPDCSGLPTGWQLLPGPTDGASRAGEPSSAWAELNKLKL